VTDYVVKGVNPWIEAPVAPVEVTSEETKTPEVKKPTKKPKKAA